MTKKRKKYSNPKIRYTKNGTPIVIKQKISEGLYIVEDFNGSITLVAENDLEE